MKKLILLPLILLTGCSLFTEIVEKPVPTVVPIVCQDFTRPDPIITLDVDFVKVYDNGRYYIGLTGQDYSFLAINNRRTINYIKEQNGVINYLLGCIQDHNTKVEND